MPFRDLPPRGDVKGGSPRTPIPMPVSEYQTYSTNGNGNGVWKAIATGLGGLVVGLLIAWFTAFQNKGVTTPELQQYVEKYSPYSQQREVINQHFTSIDGSIGELRGKQDKAFERINKNENDIEKTNLTLERLTTDVKNKMGNVATMLEEQKAKK